MGVTAAQSLEFAFALPTLQNNQTLLDFRLALQDAETGELLGQVDTEAVGPGGGCIELMVNGNGAVFINDEPTNFFLSPGERREVIAMLLPERAAGQVRIVASLQLLDAEQRKTRRLVGERRSIPEI